MRALVLVIAAACGGSATRENSMISSSIGVDAIGAPHVAVFVTNKAGLHRVWLDSGRTELVTESLAAKPIDDTTVAAVIHTKLVILRGRDTIEVPGLTIDRDAFEISRDRSLIAVQQKNAFAIVRVADGSVTMHTMPPLTRDYETKPSVTWAKDGGLLVVYDLKRYRVDVATGTRTVLENDLDWRAALNTEPNVCPAHGVRLERRVTRDRQELVVVPLASTTDPEQLASIAERPLVAATNHGRGSARFAEPPAALEVAMFTPACEHFVFTFGERVYVGNVKTGAHAFVLRGEPVRPPP